MQVHRLGCSSCLGLPPAASHRRLCGVTAGDTGSLPSLQLLLPLPSLMLHCYLAPARVVSWQAAGNALPQPLGCIHACVAEQGVEGGGGRVWWDRLGHLGGHVLPLWVVHQLAQCCTALAQGGGSRGRVPSPSAPLGKQAAQRRPLWVCGIGIGCSLYRAAPGGPACVKFRLPALLFLLHERCRVALTACSAGAASVFCLLVGWFMTGVCPRAPQVLVWGLNSAACHGHGPLV